ncbi:ATP dependent DNA ligase [Paenibacillus mucilaginosus 3016]|uniref:DNA ligase (ATP) n=2 Tax=Paenibacillus mucilaginosus TaxID=61624 RepID=H6NQN9_9BACL|nr:DNA ligase [Paenibacillus mucilaginosus]AFC33507.1 ATP dependent DNA ligase [Paenibacillus mucilaginosus 3016]AFH65827.2 DNA ligase [Paenibacillus mucilaginosus K02]WFA21911.1 DNA ligase [Paenibacillus mucilaginosus]
MEWQPIVPFEPIRTETAPSGDGWVGQIKWDGTRILTYASGGTVRLFNRKGHERTLQYPELLDLSSYCTAESVILDGEVIAIADGRPNFQEVMRRDSVRKAQHLALAQKQVPISYMIFDMPYLDGEWITDKPLRERQRLLQERVRGNATVQLVPSVAGMNDLFGVMKQHKMEGIVCKDLESKYLIGGKDKRWQKMKIYNDLVAVVGGVTHRAGQVNALMLGLYDAEGRLWYIGHAGTGRFTQQTWRELTEKVREMTLPERPFVNVPERSKDAVWIKPLLTVKVSYMEWTAGRTLRQPSIQALVGAQPADCTFGQLDG